MASAPYPITTELSNSAETMSHSIAELVLNLEQSLPTNFAR